MPRTRSAPGRGFRGVAIPVVVTVAGLTLGWIALSRERASQVAPPANGSASQQTAGQTIGSAAAKAAAAGGVGDRAMIETESDSHPAAVTLQTFPEGSAEVANTGRDPSTSPSFAPDALAVGTVRGEASDATPAAGVSADTSIALAYGPDTNGLSKAQQARAMEAYGAALGDVW